VVLEFEFGASCLLGKCVLPLESLHQNFLVLGIFKTGSEEIFVQAGFEPHQDLTFVCVYCVCTELSAMYGRQEGERKRC
jgi:hypothetical protein